MKRHFLVLALCATVSGAGLFTSCNEKAKTPEKTETGTTATDKSGTPVATTDTSATVSEETTVTPAATNTAAAQKFGYINSADLIKLMPETKKAEANLQAYVKTLETHFGGMQGDYQKKITEFQSQEKTMIDAVKESKIKDLQDLEMRMQQTQAQGQQQVAVKREQLFKPILDRAEKAVKDVGKENGYDYIFDTNTGSFIYAKEAHNVLPLVKKKLGIR